jgi:hypothetical protein
MGAGKDGGEALSVIESPARFAAMNVYVPASSAPPSPGWKQQLSILVVFGSGLAIAAVATSTFYQPGKVAPRTEPLPEPAKLAGADIASIAPTAGDLPNAPQAPASGTGTRAPQLPQAATIARQQLFFTQSDTSVEPTALPRQPSHQLPPSSFMAPIAIPDAPGERGVSVAPASDIPSNMAVVGDGVYQVSSGTPAAEANPVDTVIPAPSAASSQVEVTQDSPENALNADRHGTLPDTAGTCVTDQPVEAQEPAQAQDGSSDSAASGAVVESRPGDPQVRIAANAPPPDQVQPAETAAPVVAPAEDGVGRPAKVVPPIERSDYGGQIQPPAATSNGDYPAASLSSSSSSQADRPGPCKISVQVKGRPALEIPLLLVQDSVPAIRLSSLLDLVRPDLPPDEFQRLRGSAAASAVLSLHDLMTAGFNFQVVDGVVAIALTG